MAGDVLFLGWGDVKTGREKLAVDLFGEAVEYWGRLQQEGQIESFEPFFLAAHGGDLGGFFIVRGERAKLAQVRFSEEFELLLLRVTTLLNNVGVIAAYTGDSLAQQMSLYQQATSDLVS